MLDPQLSVVRRRAACIGPRGSRPRSSNPALQRRSDQSSRRMLGRGMAQAVEPEIVLQRRDLAGRRKRRTKYDCRQAGEAFGAARRHEHALVAIDRRRSLWRTARHVVCHLVRRCGHRHIVRRRHIRRRASHDRSGQRSQDQARDHEDREQPAHGDLPVHASKSHRYGKIESLSG